MTPLQRTHESLAHGCLFHAASLICFRWRGNFNLDAFQCLFFFLSLFILLVENTLFLRKTPKEKKKKKYLFLAGSQLCGQRVVPAQVLMALRTTSCSGGRLVLFGNVLELRMPLGRCREAKAVFRTL